MTPFTIKTGDTSPTLSYALIPTSVNLTGATVVFNMARRGVTLLDRAAATVTTATVTPTVEYTWLAGDTALEGLHLAEFEVTFASGAVETFPNGDYIQIKILDDLG
jgi:hypothetical protein